MLLKCTPFIHIMTLCIVIKFGTYKQIHSYVTLSYNKCTRNEYMFVCVITRVTNTLGIEYYGIPYSVLIMKICTVL